MRERIGAQSWVVELQARCDIPVHIQGNGGDRAYGDEFIERIELLPHKTFLAEIKADNRPCVLLPDFLVFT